MFSTLITAAELIGLIDAGSARVVDCRFDLRDTAAGFEAYRQGHIPGAVYAHLGHDLSSEPVTDQGRHPLPSAPAMCTTFRRLGLSNDTQVVAYDDAHGMVAARLWWMLRYLGHDAVAVLDGGWQAWCAGELPQVPGVESVPPGQFTGEAAPGRLVTLDELETGAALIDAREPRRYRGETEPLDPRPGHIPGASNHWFMENLDADGRFRSQSELRQAFEATLGTLPTGGSVHYCGSGVSACHNVLAQVHAGLDEPRLYCGSWSEWCADPARPAALGDGE